MSPFYFMFGKIIQTYSKSKLAVQRCWGFLHYLCKQILYFYNEVCLIIVYSSVTYHQVTVLH